MKAKDVTTVKRRMGGIEEGANHRGCGLLPFIFAVHFLVELSVRDQMMMMKKEIGEDEVYENCAWEEEEEEEEEELV